jgi:aspartyl-tRNA(Asn)/glutamyl-tRNA(Gln) amidotransferase subunit A
MELSGLTLVVAQNIVFDDIEDAVAANFERVIEALARQGARIERRTLPSLEEAQRVTAAHGTITAAEAYWLYRDLVDGPEGGRIDPRVVARIVRGKQMSAHDLLSVQDMRARMSRAVRAELNGALLAMPTTPHTAPEIAPLEADQERFHRVNLKTLRNTILGNILDLAGLALPSGRDGQGLPTGILVSAPGEAQERLMSAGLAIEAAILDL